MHKYLVLAALSCIFVGLTAFAVEPSDDCAAKLLAAPDRFLGAVRTCLKKGTLTGAMLDELAEAGKPLNPYRSATPGSSNASARRIFDEFLAEPGVQEHWPAIAIELKQLALEFGGKDKMRDDASHAVARIAAPQLAMKIEDAFDGQRAAVTMLPSGEDAIAYVNQANWLIVLRIPDKQVLFKQKLGDMSSYRLTWHTDADGALWLYGTESGNDRRGRAAATYFYRLKWGEKEIQYIRHDGLPARIGVANLFSAGPGYVIANCNGDGEVAVANLAGNKVVQLTRTARNEYAVAVDDDGRLYTPKSDDPSATAIFKTATGQILQVKPIRTGFLDIEDLGTHKSTELRLHFFGNITDLRLTSWAGRTLLAVAMFDGKDSVLSVFDLSQPENPIASQKLNIRPGDILHWVHDSDGAPLVLLREQGPTYPLVVLDMLRNYLVRLPIDVLNDYGYVYAREGQAYVWYTPGNDILIYRLFNRTGE